MVQSFKVKKGDTGRDLVMILKGGDGTVQDLTGATVRFSMRRVGQAARKVDNQPATIDSPATAGKVRYLWAAADVDTPGFYQGEFVVTLPNAKQITFPSDDAPNDFVEVVVLEDV